MGLSVVPDPSSRGHTAVRCGNQVGRSMFVADSFCDFPYRKSLPRGALIKLIHGKVEIWLYTIRIGCSCDIFSRKYVDSKLVKIAIVVFWYRIRVAVCDS